MSEYIKVGKISGYFGVAGEVKLYSYTRPIAEIQQYTQFYLGEGKSPILFTRIRDNKKHIIGKIDGKNNRNDVLDLIGLSLYIRPEDLPALPEGEYYWRDLIGLAVRNQQGIDFGIIESILETGANDVLVIKNHKTGDETLVPFVLEHFIISVDLANKTMLVDWEMDWEADDED